MTEPASEPDAAPPTSPAATSPTARYAWPNVPDQAVTGPAASVARRILLSRARTVGFLSAEPASGNPATLAPLLAKIAEAMRGFVSEDIGLIDEWQTWPWGQGSELGQGGAYSTRRLGDRLIEIAGVPCGDPEAATIALGAALEHRPASLATTLVNLSGYAAPEAVPAAVALVERVVLVAIRRRTAAGTVLRMLGALAAKQALGVVLAG